MYSTVLGASHILWGDCSQKIDNPKLDLYWVVKKIVTLKPKCMTVLKSPELLEVP